MERNNAKVIRLLRLFTHTERGSWDEFIETVANSINNNYNLTLNDTPSYAFLGYDTEPQGESAEEEILYSYDTVEDRLKHRELKNLEIRRNIKRIVEASQSAQHLRKNLGRKEKRSIEVGDRVIFRSQNRKSKLSLQFVGPGTVTEVGTNKVAVRVGNKEYDRVHVNNVISLNKSRKT